MDLEKKYNLELKAGKDFTVKENHWLPNKMGVDIIVFGKVMYCKNKLDEIPMHEFLHVAQFRKYGILLVMLHYFFYVTINIFRYRDISKAFSQVPFEIEARNFEHK